jgi:hypothetical protein
VTFEHPLLAFGALAALIPPLLHLFDRRKARPQPFAAMEFLLRAMRVGARSLRLRRILLMAARMALLAAIPLALARPHRQAKAAVISSAQAGPQATILLLDASGSMRYHRGGGTLFREAQEAARRRLQDLSSDEPVSVQICEARGKPAPLPGFDRVAARSAIDQAQATVEPADIALCLDGAAQALAASEVPGKRIVVFTDLTAAGWDLTRPAPEVATSHGTVKPEVEVHDVAREPMPNLALSDLNIQPSSAVGAHGYQISFLVHNFGAAAVQNVPVDLKVGGATLVRGFADVPAMGTEHKVLGASFEPGTVAKGQVELQADALTEDDALPFVVSVPRQARVLIVDGAASSLRYLDEAFFTQTALQATEGAVLVHTVDPDAVTAADLARTGDAKTGDLDAVLLLNVHALSKEVAAALKRFVDKGGGLFVALGDRVDPDSLNETLGSLLPSPLRLVKTAANPPRETVTPDNAKGSMTTQGPAHLAQIDYASPIFAPFNAAAREGLLEAQFYRYMLVEPPPADVHVLAAYDDGSPALLTARRGAGHVVLFTSSVAREWSDWPIRVSFVPVIQQIVLGLSGVVQTSSSAPDLIGASHQFAPSEAPAVAALTPSGKELAATPDASGASSVGPLTELGIYRTKVKAANGTIETPQSLDFAVSFDPRESDTRRLDPLELQAHYNAKVSTESGPVDEEHRRTPIWTELLAAAALLFLAETLLLG